MSDEIPNFHRDRALAQGWDIFDCGGAHFAKGQHLPHTTTRELRVQKCDELDILDNDDQAIALARKMGVDVADDGVVRKRSLNGGKTRPLSDHALGVLRNLKEGPLLGYLINPGVRDRLDRENLAYQDGRVWRITDTGIRRLLVESEVRRLWSES